MTIAADVRSLLRRLATLLHVLGTLTLGGCTGEVENGVASDPPGGSAGSAAMAGNTGMTVSCPVGQTACGGACFDMRSSAANCGKCGASCRSDQLCDQSACKATAAGCSAGLTACGSSCLDVGADANNCGVCGRVCEAGKVCSGGACVCAAGQTPCGASCVDVAKDAANCGTCGNACSGGRSCQGGACGCVAGQSFCGDSCIDTNSSAQNCGACGLACTGGKVCGAGQCVCAAGQTACGQLCVDVKSNDANCGACGQACSLGQVCSAGSCGGGGGVREDGCSGIAQNISISALAIYQTVKISLMQAGAEVPAAMRNTDVVAGRDAMLRVFTSVGSGWTARELSARVFLQNAGAIDTLYAKRNVTGSTQEADLLSSFQINIPKDKLKPDTKYALELVECGGTPSGGVQMPRFPASDGLSLGARTTGALKVRIIPLQVNSLVPDTTETALQVYKAMFTATYPIASIEMSVGDVVTISSATDWTGNLDRMRSKRQTDAPAADIYYYGMLKPAATLREFCGSGCTTGIGYVPQGNANNQASQRVAMGIGFADSASADTIVHEVAHNHGRQHAPCGGVDGADASYPYSGGQIGVYGYDARTQKLVAPDRTDIMGYCQNKWFSDYTYDGLLNRVASVNGAQANVIAGPVAAWRVLLLDALGPRWGIPFTSPAEAAGVAESAEILDLLGRVVEKVTVYRSEISDVAAASFEVPPPKDGWHSIRVSGAVAYPFGAPTFTPSP